MCHFCYSRIKAETKPSATHGQFHFSKEEKKRGGGEEKTTIRFVFTHQDLVERLKVCCSQEAPRMNPPNPIFIFKKKLDQLLRVSQM